MAKKHYVTPNEIVRMEIPYSEVCMHMQVAGKVMEVRFQKSERGYASAQLLRDGQEYSAAITPGEAGFYYEDGQYYCYTVEVL